MESFSRYQRRMSEMRAALGGKCRFCGADETQEGIRLHIDHVNPAHKASNLSRLWSARREIRDAELAKCQLLCTKCHEGKTNTDFGKKSAKGVHGTISSYRYCKCDLCCAAKAKSNQSQYLRRRGA